MGTPLSDAIQRQIRLRGAKQRYEGVLQEQGANEQVTYSRAREFMTNLAEHLPGGPAVAAATPQNRRQRTGVAGFLTQTAPAILGDVASVVTGGRLINAAVKPIAGAALKGLGPNAARLLSQRTGTAAARNLPKHLRGKGMLAAQLGDETAQMIAAGLAGGALQGSPEQMIALGVGSAPLPLIGRIPGNAVTKRIKQAAVAAPVNAAVARGLGADHDQTLEAAGFGAAMQALLPGHGQGFRGGRKRGAPPPPPWPSRAPSAARHQERCPALQRDAAGSVGRTRGRRTPRRSPARRARASSGNCPRCRTG